MSKYLCTFPGKYGDILWSLPTAKYIAEKVVSSPVDFAVMPYYESLLPLIQEQSYIDRAYVNKGWLRTHSNYGDQPWEMPLPVFDHNSLDDYSYERVWHLGYRCHPGRAFGNVEMPLMEFVAYQQGITFHEPIIPFLTVEKNWAESLADENGMDFGSHIVLALNEQYAEQKTEFKNALAGNLTGITSVLLLDENITWAGAARLTRDAMAYVGDRSANWVIANGLGKQCITFEPHPSRHASGHLGKVFGCPGGKEIALPFNMPAAVAGQSAAAMVKKMVEERMVTHG